MNMGNEWINIWIFPPDVTVQTIYLMKAPSGPLCYLNLSIVSAEFGDTERWALMQNRPSGARDWETPPAARPSLAPRRE